VIVGLGPGIRLSAKDLPFAVGAVAIGTIAAWIFAASARSAERRSVWIQVGLAYAGGVLVTAFFPVLERLFR